MGNPYRVADAGTLNSSRIINIIIRRVPYGRITRWWRPNTKRHPQGRSRQRRTDRVQEHLSFSGVGNARKKIHTTSARGGPLGLYITKLTTTKLQHG